MGLRAIARKNLRGTSAQDAPRVSTDILHGCGAPVPTVDRGIIRVPAGTLDGDPGIRPQRHLFVDFKAPWFEITDSLGQFGTKPKPS